MREKTPVIPSHVKATLVALKIELDLQRRLGDQLKTALAEASLNDFIDRHLSRLSHPTGGK